jgi:hypothetical protein
MSTVTGRLSDDDLRELARLVRVIHADAEAWRMEQHRPHGADDPAAKNGGGHDDPR